MSNPCSRLPVRFTASATSLCVAASVICCGARRVGSYALWPSSTPLGVLHPDVHRYVAQRRRDHSPLCPALQDRVQLQAGRTSDRFIRLPFLDEGHDSVALPQWQSISSSQVGRLPKPCQTQNARLSYLHPGRRCRPGVAPVSRCRCSQASLTKFIAERQDTENMRTFRLASRTKRRTLEYKKRSANLRNRLHDQHPNLGSHESWKPMWTPLFRGPDWMPITPKWGSFLHADSHRPVSMRYRFSTFAIRTSPSRVTGFWRSCAPRDRSAAWSRSAISDSCAGPTVIRFSATSRRFLWNSSTVSPCPEQRKRRRSTRCCAKTRRSTRACAVSCNRRSRHSAWLQWSPIRETSHQADRRHHG